MPDDDALLGQNEVDVRNEARKPMHEIVLRRSIHIFDDAEQAFADQDVERDLAQAIDHLRRLNETPAINENAEQRRQESITRTLDEIQRLMDA